MTAPPDLPLRFVVMEDDWMHADSIERTLRDQFSPCDVVCISTEREFRRRLDDDLKTNPPDLFILDMMVRWADPTAGERIKAPEGEEIFEAGFRCYQRLRQAGLHDRVLIYSIIDRDDLDDVGMNELIDVHLQKSGNRDELRDVIRQRLGELDRD